MLLPAMSGIAVIGGEAAVVGITGDDGNDNVRPAGGPRVVVAGSRESGAGAILGLLPLTEGAAVFSSGRGRAGITIDGGGGSLETGERVDGSVNTLADLSSLPATPGAAEYSTVRSAQKPPTPPTMKASTEGTTHRLR